MHRYSWSVVFLPLSSYFGGNACRSADEAWLLEKFRPTLELPTLEFPPHPGLPFKWRIGFAIVIRMRRNLL